MTNSKNFYTNPKLGNLKEEIDLIGPNLFYIFLLYIRQGYLNQHNQFIKKFDRYKLIKTNLVNNLPDTLIEKFNKIIDYEKLDWGDYKFHLNYRLHLNRNSTPKDFELLFSLTSISSENYNYLKSIIIDGIEIKENSNGFREKRYYDLSILPLNLLLGKEVYSQFLPPPDYLQPHPTKKADPYGIIHGSSRVLLAKKQPTIIVDNETNLILGSHKFNHTLLFNIDFYCPIGCSDCYKTRMGTREYIDPETIRTGFKPKIYKHPELGELNPPNAGSVIEQVKKTVKWMNQDPRGQLVYDVIISGGEPLMLSNDIITAILEEFKHAKNLRILRICTGTLFLGLPFRIDDVLLEILNQFSESTGVRITIQAHLSNHHMFSPEALIAINKIRKKGINIYSQIPIKNGINFFLDDINRTIDYLVELGRYQVLFGVEPYMFIVDMHPSTNAFYVPIEPLMLVWSMLVESHDFPGLERPRTLSVLFEGGNIILSGHTLFSAKKVVDEENDQVIYYIPRVQTKPNWVTEIAEVFEYKEPLIRGINDNPDSLKKLRNIWFSNYNH